MRAARLLAVGTIVIGVASCSLITSFEGLGAGGAGGASTTTGSKAASGSGGHPHQGGGGSGVAGASGGSGGSGGVAACGGSDAGGSGDACVDGGSYCGGDKVMGDPDSIYRCNADGSATFVETCAHGCVIRPHDDDMCGCEVNGLYCGGDHIVGNTGTLYRCTMTGGVMGTFYKHCANACVVAPAGQDDHCKSG